MSPSPKLQVLEGSALLRMQNAQPDKFFPLNRSMRSLGTIALSFSSAPTQCVEAIINDPASMPRNQRLNVIGEDSEASHRKSSGSVCYTAAGTSGVPARPSASHEKRHRANKYPLGDPPPVASRLAQGRWNAVCL